MTVQTKKFKSDSGFQTSGFSVADGLLQVNNLNASTLVTSSLEIAGASTYLTVNNGIVTITSKPGTPGAINNMNVGTTTPAAAIFTTLSVLTSLVANPTGNVSIVPGGSVTINPSTTGSLNNITIGSTTARAGTFTNLSANTGTFTNLSATTSLTAGATTVNSLTVNNDISADNVIINNVPTIVSHATRKDYVDATAAALAIALGG